MNCDIRGCTVHEEQNPQNLSRLTDKTHQQVIQGESKPRVAILPKMFSFNKIYIYIKYEKKQENVTIPGGRGR